MISHVMAVNIWFGLDRLIFNYVIRVFDKQCQQSEKFPVQAAQHYSVSCYKSVLDRNIIHDNMLNRKVQRLERLPVCY